MTHKVTIIGHLEAVLTHFERLGNFENQNFEFNFEKRAFSAKMTTQMRYDGRREKLYDA